MLALRSLLPVGGRGMILVAVGILGYDLHRQVMYRRALATAGTCCRRRANRTRCSTRCPEGETDAAEQGGSRGAQGSDDSERGSRGAGQGHRQPGRDGTAEDVGGGGSHSRAGGG